MSGGVACIGDVIRLAYTMTYSLLFFYLIGKGQSPQMVPLLLVWCRSRLSYTVPRCPPECSAHQFWTVPHDIWHLGVHRTGLFTPSPPSPQAYLHQSPGLFTPVPRLIYTSPHAHYLTVACCRLQLQDNDIILLNCKILNGMTKAVANHQLSFKFPLFRVDVR